MKGCEVSVVNCQKLSKAVCSASSECSYLQRDGCAFPPGVGSASLM